MSASDDAYHFARRLIAEAKASGASELSFNRPETWALAVLPPEIVRLDTLRSLDLQDTRISDLAPLLGLTELRSLSLVGTSVNNFAPLADLTELSSLSLVGTRISDLAPIASLIRLTSLKLGGTRVGDLTPLAGLSRLSSLWLDAPWVNDIDPLSGLTSLSSLTLVGAPVSDISSLANLASLSKLWIDGTKVGDLAPLAGLTNLSWLWLGGTLVKDLGALGSLINLSSLRLAYTTITDISQLADLVRLSSLWLDGTYISDLAPLAGLTGISILGLTDTQVTDLRPCIGMALLSGNPGQGGLSFQASAATLLDHRIAEISKIPDDRERAQTLFAYLKDWEPNKLPKVPPQSLLGFRYIVGPPGQIGYDPSNSLSSPTAQQRQLHAILREDCAELGLRCSSSHNRPFDAFEAKFARYGLGLGEHLGEVQPVLVWKAGNDLRILLRQDGHRRPGDMTHTPPLDPDLRAGIEGFVAAHNAFSALVPDLSQLDHASLDPAERLRLEQGRAEIDTIIAAFARQSHLILSEVVGDLRDLFAADINSTGAALRDLKVGQESLENLIKVIVAQAIIETHGETFLQKVAGDVRATAVAAVTVTGASALSPDAAGFAQLLSAVQPQVAALLSAHHGADYPVIRAVEWVKARIRGA